MKRKGKDMAQGEFTIEECKHARECVDEVMKAFPKNKVINFVGHFNDLFLFIDAGQRHLLAEEGSASAKKG